MKRGLTRVGETSEIGIATTRPVGAVEPKHLGSELHGGLTLFDSTRTMSPRE